MEIFYYLNDQFVTKEKFKVQTCYNHIT